MIDPDDKEEVSKFEDHQRIKKVCHVSVVHCRPADAPHDELPELLQL